MKILINNNNNKLPDLSLSYICPYLFSVYKQSYSLNFSTNNSFRFVESRGSISNSKTKQKLKLIIIIAEETWTDIIKEEGCEVEAIRK